MSISPEFGSPTLIFKLREPFLANEPCFSHKGTGKRLPKFENQSRGAGYGSRSVKTKVEEPKARLR